MDTRNKRWLGFAMAGGLILMTVACTRPSSMLVREAGDPVHADEDVAFRTTYYFRVFDSCAIRDRLAGETVNVPLNDTLYRFIMTGKASTLFSNIRFESGTLSAQEIEPFGSTVEYDSDVGQFRLRSRQDTEAEARGERALKSYERLFTLYDRITKAKPEDDSGLDDVRKELAAALKAFIADFRQTSVGPPDKDEQLRNIEVNPITPSSVSVETDDGTFRIPFSVQGPRPAPQKFVLILEAKEGEAPKATLEAQGVEIARSQPAVPIDCLNGDVPTRRGFQILGPEGWRTFDQDERLLLVMSSDAKPLISTLKELSQRLVQSRAPALVYQRTLPVERLRVANTKQALDSPPDGTTPDTLLMRAIDTFNAAEE